MTKNSPNKIIKFLKENPALIFFFLFLISFFYFLYFQLDPTLADPDSFYHAKTAVLTRDQGIIKDFPWMQFTVLKNIYIDHHFLYHIILIPFVTFFDPLVGIKFAVIIFSTLAVLVFYWLLKKLQIKYSLLYVFLLLTSAPWLFRLNLAKAQPLSLIIVFLSIYLIFKKNYWGLFFISFIYVWTYGGWPLILILAIFYLLADLIKRIYIKSKGFFYRFWRIFYHRQSLLSRTRLALHCAKRTIQENYKLLWSIVLGLCFGLIFNPYFPQNLSFYWIQIFKIGILNYGSEINVGGEWYPYLGFQLISGTIIILLLWIFSLIWYSHSFKKASVRSIFLWIVSIFFFLYTCKARRQIEYFIPLTLLCAGFSLNDFWTSIKWNDYKEKIKELFKGSSRFLSALISGYLIIVCAFFIFNYVFVCLKEVKTNLASGFPLEKFKSASQWLKNNTPQNSIIFHGCWSEFPMLFYYNDRNYYIVGLDATFMYEYDKKLYWQWANITMGNPAVDYNYDKEKNELIISEPNPVEIIKNDFHSSYVFLEKERNKKLIENLEKNQDFKEIYQDNDVKIYQVL